MATESRYSAIARSGFPLSDRREVLGPGHGTQDLPGDIRITYLRANNLQVTQVTVEGHPVYGTLTRDAVHDDL